MDGPMDGRTNLMNYASTYGKVSLPSPSPPVVFIPFWICWRLLPTTQGFNIIADGSAGAYSIPPSLFIYTHTSYNPNHSILIVYLHTFQLKQEFWISFMYVCVWNGAWGVDGVECPCPPICIGFPNITRS